MASPRPGRAETAERSAFARGSRGLLQTLPEGHYEAIVTSSEDAIITKDRDAVITSWNPGAERIYGYTSEEAVGRPISLLIPGHRRGEERRILDKILAGERVDHYETERIRKDGTEIVVSLTVSPIRDAAGEVVSASVVARDVSEQHAARELSARLLELTTALSREITPERAIEVLLEQAVAGLGAGAGAVGLLDSSGHEVVLAGSAGYSDTGLAGWDRFPLDANVPMSLAIRTGEPVWTSSVAELKERFPAFAEADIKWQSLSVIPLSVEGRTFGGISLSFLARRAFDQQEQAFLVAAAQQAAYALERARLYEAERASRERLTFLSEASELLSGSLDHGTTLRGVADLAVHRIADWCGIELLDEDGELRNVAVAHRDPKRVRQALELRSRYPVEATAEVGVPNVIRTGQPELYEDISDEMLVASAHDEDHLRLMRELGLTSAMIVPLEARGRPLGAITFVGSEEGRCYDEDDLELAQELARRAAVAIDNSMLFRREHEAAVILQRSLLPQTLPTIDGVEFAARYEPAAPGLEVGGDWYEVVPRDDGQVAVIIGDVAGRGIRAASVMGRVRPALRAYVLDEHGPEGAMERLDRLMRDFDRVEMTTVFHLQFDPAADRAQYVRAGHPPGLLRRPDGDVVELAGGGTPPLGILERIDYRVHEVEVPPGSMLLLYTDGLIERRDTDLRHGLDRLKEALAGAEGGAADCVEAIARQFTADAVPDDVAMLAMSVQPNGR
ncbi:MAG TPA: SpoIIE family protein phosphatase [Solirubrobacterales bacterium]|nr:SpoIIE family protein phosphatase [Solirubrobacterales bacterium]